jgi:hypothetical protein
MTLDTVIMLFGAFVAILPFLQFPLDWMNFFAFLAGIIIIGLGIAVRRRGLRHSSSSDQGQLFEAASTQEESVEEDEEVQEQ